MSIYILYIDCLNQIYLPIIEISEFLFTFTLLNNYALEFERNIGRRYL